MIRAFNPALLLLARKYRGLSQAHVAKAAGLNQGHYSRIENGLLPDGPSETNIALLAGVLRLPVDFFYQSDDVYGLPLSVHPMHRKNAKVGETTLQYLQAELNIRLIHLRYLLNAVETEAELPLPWIDIDEGGGAEAVAATVRKLWGIPRGPFPNLSETIERAGALVIWCGLSAGIDGLTLRAPDLPPCIFLNRSAPADRMRFSLAHELGHIVMHRVPTDDIENEANAFARGLLLPAADVRKDFVGRVNLERLIRLKSVWRVSVQLLLYRAKEIGAVSQNQSQYLWRQIAKLGWRTREPADTDFPHEEPRLFPEVLRLHTGPLGYSRGEMARLLRVDGDDLGHLYGMWQQTGAAAHLRLVK